MKKLAKKIAIGAVALTSILNTAFSNNQKDEEKKYFDNKVQEYAKINVEKQLRDDTYFVLNVHDLLSREDSTSLEEMMNSPQKTIDETYNQLDKGNLHSAHLAIVNYNNENLKKKLNLNSNDKKESNEETYNKYLSQIKNDSIQFIAPNFQDISELLVTYIRTKNLHNVDLNVIGYQISPQGIAKFYLTEEGKKIARKYYDKYMFNGDYYILENGFEKEKRNDTVNIKNENIVIEIVPNKQEQFNKIQWDAAYEEETEEAIGVTDTTLAPSKLVLYQDFKTHPNFIHFNPNTPLKTNICDTLPDGTVEKTSIEYKEYDGKIQYMTQEKKILAENNVEIKRTYATFYRTNKTGIPSFSSEPDECKIEGISTFPDKEIIDSYSYMKVNGKQKLTNHIMTIYSNMQTLPGIVNKVPTEQQTLEDVNLNNSFRDKCDIIGKSVDITSSYKQN